MAQRGIGVSDDSYQKFQLAIERMSRMGTTCSASMMLEYLVTFFFTISDGYDYAITKKTMGEVGQALMDLVRGALHSRPPARKRRYARPSEYAPLEKRLEMVQMIRDRLGMEDPPKVFVDYYLDQGANALIKIRQTQRVLDEQNANPPMPSAPAMEVPPIARLT